MGYQYLVGRSVASSKVLGELCAPEIKLFLIRLLSLFGVESHVQLSEKKIAIRLGLSSVVVNRSLKYLVGVGYLSKELGFTENGRPPQTYRCERKLKIALDELQEASEESPHLSLINSLLGGDSMKYPDLKPSGRILLATLLMNSGVCGVVRGLGRTDLTKITGMKVDKLKLQVFKLHEAGYIDCIVPGATGANMFGCVSAVYFINLDVEKCVEREQGLDSLNQDAKYRKIPLSKLEIEHSSKIYELMSDLTNLLKAGQRPGLEQAGWDTAIGRLTFGIEKIGFKVADYPQIVRFFDSQKGGGHLHILQMKLEEYAGVLLSNHWEDLDTEGCEHDGQLMKLIENEAVLVKQKPVKTEPKSLISKQIEALAKFIYAIAWSIARKVKAEMKQKNEELVLDRSYAIMPFSLKRGCFTLICMSPD